MIQNIYSIYFMIPRADARVPSLHFLQFLADIFLAFGSGGAAQIAVSFHKLALVPLRMAQ
jgi:hypothetical protein